MVKLYKGGPEYSQGSLHPVFYYRPVRGYNRREGHFSNTTDLLGFFLRLKLAPILLGSIVLLSEVAYGEALAKAKELYLKGERDRAQTVLEKWISNGRKKDEGLPQGQMLLGLIHYENQRYEEARQMFEGVLAARAEIAPYAFYHLGDTYRRLGRNSDALNAFARVGYFSPPSELKAWTRFRMAEVAFAQKKYAVARKHFRYLERRWRNAPHVPEVYWSHLKMAMADGNRRERCQIAKKLYARFPHHQLVSGWGLDLQGNSVDGERLGCIATDSERSARLRRLQLSGESARAREELDQWRSRLRDPYQADLVLAQFLIQDGYPREALEILLKHYPSHQKNSGFLRVVARATARAGEHKASVGTLLRIHELHPKSLSGREALYQAAFSSYQNRDYDGARRKFEEFIGSYSRSSLVKDAKWHMAWMEYLRGNYDTAVEEFERLADRRDRRGRKLKPEDRVRYWLAMSHWRLGNGTEARKLFESLVESGELTYYGQAALARLEKIPSESLSLPQALELRAPSAVASQVEGESASDSDMEVQAEAEAEAEARSEDSDEEGGLLLAGDDEAIASDEDEKVSPTVIRDPRLKRKFDTAQELMSIGQYEWARHELYEVERRSRNPDYLRSLIQLYSEMGAYHRGVAITSSGLAGQRFRLGIDGARDLWEAAYPRAFSKHVKDSSSRFEVPINFIWSIMHAESSFRPDAVSPVGARGLLQMMPGTGLQIARLLGEQENYDPTLLSQPEVNIRYGGRYLSRLFRKFQGAMPLVAAGYNAGPHRVDTWMSTVGYLDGDEFIEHIPFVETRNYVKKVMRNYAIYQRLYSGKGEPQRVLASALPASSKYAPSPREDWQSQY